jgi:phosphonate transport system permease protein
MDSGEVTPTSNNSNSREAPPPRKRNPLIALFLALIPGLGHFYNGLRLRGLVLILLIPILTLLTIWRLDIGKVDFFGILDGNVKLADMTRASIHSFNMGVALFIMIALVYLWNLWDAYSTAGGKTLPARLPFILLFIVSFIIGWDVTEINLYKAINEVGDIVPRLSQLAWPWDQAFEKGEVVTEAVATWVTPCTENPPSQPEAIEGQPYIYVEPTCGEISGPAKPDGSRELGTEITVVGRGFDPNTEATLWWDPESISEFRPRASGQLVQIHLDENGGFRFDFPAPNFTIPAVSTREITSKVIVRQIDYVGSLRPSEDLLLAASLMIETIYLGMMATLFGMVLAVPVSFLAARNLMADNQFTVGVYLVTRSILNIIRSIEPLIWAIIAAAWVGLGPFAGTIALTLHSIAALGKLYSEAIESIDSGPIEALEATGANRLQVIIYAVLPQVIPPFVSFTVYRWDINVRMSTIIGAVGGGGIGFILIQWIRLGDFDSAGIAVWFIAITVTVLDYISSQLRKAYV